MRGQRDARLQLPREIVHKQSLDIGRHFVAVAAEEVLEQRDVVVVEALRLAQGSGRPLVAANPPVFRFGAEAQLHAALEHVGAVLLVLVHDNAVSGREIEEQDVYKRQVYNWTRSKKGKVIELAADSARPLGEGRAWSGFEGSEEERIAQLELENDILRGVVEVLKADRLDALTNREKTILIEHLRRTTSRPLRELTDFLRISKSSYEYQRASLAKPDKYAEARKRVVEEFEAANRTRGYRYLTHVLRQGRNPLVLSEKVVRRLMAEEGCRVIYLKKAKRYSSYAGETVSYTHLDRDQGNEIHHRHNRYLGYKGSGQLIRREPDSRNRNGGRCDGQH